MGKMLTYPHDADAGACAIIKPIMIRKHLKTRPRCPECEDLTYVSLAEGKSFGRNECKNCLWQSRRVIERPSIMAVLKLSASHTDITTDEAFVLLCVESAYRPFASDEPKVISCCETLYAKGYLNKISGELQDLYVFVEHPS